MGEHTLERVTSHHPLTALHISVLCAYLSPSASSHLALIPAFIAFIKHDFIQLFQEEHRFSPPWGLPCLLSTSTQGLPVFLAELGLSGC